MYHASKAGFSNYLEGLALALKPKGVYISNSEIPQLYAEIENSIKNNNILGVFFNEGTFRNNYPKSEDIPQPFGGKHGYPEKRLVIAGLG